jgi:hypothetical protein
VLGWWDKTRCKAELVEGAKGNERDDEDTAAVNEVGMGAVFNASGFVHVVICLA